MRRLILAFVLLFPTLVVSQEKDLDRVLSRAATYVETYTADLGGVIAEERYVQKGKWSCGGCNSLALDSSSEAARHMNAIIDGGAMILGDGITVDPTDATPPVAGEIGASPSCGAATGSRCPEFGTGIPRSKSMATAVNLLAYESRERTLLSDFRTTPVGNAWLGTRHVREVDGIVIDPSFRGRLAGNYDLSTFTGLLQLKNAIGFENARYTIGDSYFTTSIPTSPLEVLRRNNIGGYTFQKRGEENIDNIRTWKVEGTDRAGLLTGMFWIEPETGRILRTEFGTKDFIVRPNGPAVWTTVHYGVDDAVGMLVPVSMDEEYKDAGFLMGGQGHADYTNYRRFRADVRLVANAEDNPAAPGDPNPSTTAGDSAKVDDPSVTIDAWVTGSNGKVLNLKADDFVVTENNVPQPVTKFSPVNAPYDVLLLFERSGGSIGGTAACSGPCSYPASLMQRAAQSLIAGLQPQDRIGVAGFGSYFHMLTHWSDTAEQQLKAFSQLSSFPDVTFFYRSIEHALISELPPVAGRRRALVVLADGRDFRMTNSIKQLSRVVPENQNPAFLEMIDVARREHIPVYVVAINTDRNLMSGTGEDDVYVQLQSEYFFKGLLHPSDKNLRSLPQDYLAAMRTGMEQLAQASGGRIFFPKKREDLIPLYRQIGEEIGTAYSFGYVSSLPAGDRGAREVAVTVKNSNLHVVQSRSDDSAQTPQLATGAATALATLGQSSFDAGDFQHAVEQLAEAVRLGGMSPSVYFTLGSSYYKLGQVDLAEANLLQALTVDAGFKNAYLQLYNVYMLEQKPQKALAAAEAYLAKYPDAGDREYVQSMVEKLKTKLKP